MVYTVVLFLHILGALGYVAGLAIVYACVVGMRRARTTQALYLWAGMATRVTRTVVPIGGAGVTLAGLYLYFAAWRADGSWALVALGAFVVVGAVTGAVQGRWIAALAARIEDQPEAEPLASAPAVAARDGRLLLTANGTLGAVVGILLLMVMKPVLVTSLAMVGGAAILGLLLGAVLGRLPEHASAPTESGVPA